MIVIVDYGMGNLRSVYKALESLGLEVRVSSGKQDILDARAVVLPGVGAFRDCMRNLDHLGLVDVIQNCIRSGKPFLGICLGLQILFTESEEFGKSEGMNLFPGRVCRFPENLPDLLNSGGFLKVPHMGWNQVLKKKDCPVLENIPSGSYFYFVHSYYVVPDEPDLIAATTDYGLEFVSAIARDNVFACQFHPEKSQRIGLALLKNFGEMADGKV